MKILNKSKKFRARKQKAGKKTGRQKPAGKNKARRSQPEKHMESAAVREKAVPRPPLSGGPSLPGESAPHSLLPGSFARENPAAGRDLPAQAIADQTKRLKKIKALKPADLPERTEVSGIYFAGASAAEALSSPEAEEAFGGAFPDDELCSGLKKRLFDLERDVAFFRFAVKEIEDITGK